MQAAMESHVRFAGVGQASSPTPAGRVLDWVTTAGGQRGGPREDRHRARGKCVSQPGGAAFRCVRQGSVPPYTGTTVCKQSSRQLRIRVIVHDIILPAQIHSEDRVFSVSGINQYLSVDSLLYVPRSPKRAEGWNYRECCILGYVKENRILPKWEVGTNCKDRSCVFSA